jgi:hypothetical protein
MDKLGHRTLVEYTSLAEGEGREVRRMRPRTLIYVGLLSSLILFGGVLMAQRVPFEATVNRVPGSLFTVDPDGYVRNTFLLMLTNNNPGNEAMEFSVSVEGLEGAEVLFQDVSLDSNDSVTLPLIVRLPLEDSMERTIPIDVKVVSAAGELIVPTTFKSGTSMGGGS